MAIHTITLPESLEEFIEAQLADGGYATPGEYLCALVADAQQRQAKGMRLEQLLLDGLNSGPSFEVTADYWKAKQRRIEERHAEAKNA